MLVVEVGVGRRQAADHGAGGSALQHDRRGERDGSGRVVLVDLLTARDHVVLGVGEGLVAWTRPAPHRIVEPDPVAGIHRVGVAAAAEEVAAGPTGHGVSTRLAAQQVLAGTTAQLVITCAATELIGAAASDQLVVTAAAADHVVAAGADEQVRTIGALDGAPRLRVGRCSATGASAPPNSRSIAARKAATTMTTESPRAADTRSALLTTRRNHDPTPSYRHTVDRSGQRQDRQRDHTPADPIRAFGAQLRTRPRPRSSRVRPATHGRE